MRKMTIIILFGTILLTLLIYCFPKQVIAYSTEDFVKHTIAILATIGWFYLFCKAIVFTNEGLDEIPDDY